VIGARVWDRQHKIRIHIGELGLQAYEDFLPGGAALRKLVDLVRQYLCFEFDWDLRLSLRAVEQPGLRLGRFVRLGWTTWAGRPPGDRGPDDLILDAEASTARHGSDHAAAT
jgi:type VI secretion system protein ImpH